MRPLEALHPWNPSASGGTPQTYVGAVAVIGSNVYASGDFTSIGFALRNRLAALNATTGAALATWNPNPNGAVNTLVKSGSVLYAGGAFTSIAGWTTYRVAALDTTTGNALGFYAALNGEVRALALSGSTLYAGGDFTASGAQTYERLVALDSSSGNPSAWSPGANKLVFALAADGSRSTREATSAWPVPNGETTSPPWISRPEAPPLGIPT